MATGPCGINCDVCKLHIIGSCTTCGPGKSKEAFTKLAIQKSMFGNGCPILECACLNKINYCMRDCNLFPCENFSTGPYPYSPGFLDMQKRRLSENPKAISPQGQAVIVPGEYWDLIVTKNVTDLCNFTLSEPHEKGIIFPFLNREIIIDFTERCLKDKTADTISKIDDPLLELLTLVYFNHVESLYPKGKKMISSKDLKEAHFFKGPHELNLTPLLRRFQDNLDDFREAAGILNGTPVDMADMAYKFMPFPRIPLYFLFWKKDEEFDAGVDVLFDKSIENCLDAAGIWGLVNLVTRCILQVRNN